MTIENYEKEFSFHYAKHFLFMCIITPILGVFIIHFFALNQALYAFIIAIIIFLVAHFLGYLLAYKKVLFSYNNSVIKILFKGGYFSKKNITYEINLVEVEEYNESVVFRGTGRLQFIMKDSSIIEVAYSPDIETNVNLRSEILKVLEDNNIKRTCVF
ncbi:hypothetical protein IJD34_04285 [bacterium]|nr:hypothetical protein [bacterium]